MLRKKLIRITTVPTSLGLLLKGQLKYMSDYYEVVGVSSDGPDLYKVAEREGVRVIPVSMKRKVSVFNDIISVYTMYKVFRKEKPFIVHTHTPKAGMAGMIAARLAGVPVRLHSIAGLPLMEASGVKRKILDLVEKITYKCAHRIYPVSFGLKDYILEHNYCAPEKVKVIGKGSSNGIDLDHFDPEQFSVEDKAELKEKLNLTNENFIFIFVGRIVTDKGVNELVKAFVKINKQYPLSRLLFVGDYEKDRDPVLPETEHEIASNPAIISVGFQNDVRPYFAISDVLVFPSYREGYPNVVLQSVAMNKPVIATNIVGCNEIIANDINGFLVKPKSIQDIYDKMEFYLKNKDTYVRHSASARDRISKYFDREYVWQCLLDEYRSFENKILNN